MEQEEYTKEEIDWSYIEFVDNQDVLDLIEKVGMLCCSPVSKADYYVFHYENWGTIGPRFVCFLLPSLRFLKMSRSRCQILFANTCEFMPHSFLQCLFT